jgi:phosphatidylserine/phosphatidylglycerophosphate/cardiolipin synthase-like enzyme
LNLFILLSQAHQYNENLSKIVIELQALDDSGKKQYIQNIERIKGRNSSTSIINLLHEVKSRGFPESFLINLVELKNDLTEIFPYKEPEAVITLPAYLKYDLPSSQLSGTLSTLEAINKIFQLSKKEVIIITAFTSVSMANILGPLIAESTKEGKKITLIAQPKNDKYDPEPALRRLFDIVTENGDTKHLSLLRMDLGAKGMMHLKILISDRTAALVGSANMTKGAMRDNIEAGFLVYGSPSAILSRIISALIENQKRKIQKEN